MPRYLSISFSPPIGNLHINVIADAYTKEVEELLEPFIYEVVGASFHFEQNLVEQG